MVPSASWEEELARWTAPFLERIGRAERRKWAPPYRKGLLLPGEWKSIEPLAERVCAGDVRQLHHFISTSPWPTAPLQEVLFEKADRLVGGREAVLLIDDTALVEQGRHSAEHWPRSSGRCSTYGVRAAVSRSRCDRRKPDSAE